jgi:hypothetical protein
LQKGKKPYNLVLPNIAGSILPKSACYSGKQLVCPEKEMAPSPMPIPETYGCKAPV